MISVTALQEKNLQLEKQHFHDQIDDLIDKNINERNCNEILHVILVVSNPVNYHRRYELFEKCIDRFGQHPQIKLYTTELQQGNKPYQTSAKYKYRTNHEIWHKENLINLTVQKLDKNWTKMAWIDADIAFINPNWVRDTLDALEHYKVVQLFQNAIDLGPNLEVLNVFTGIGYAHCMNLNISYLQYCGHDGITNKFYHPGYGYAINRKAFNKIGGLIDYAILGSADSHMAYSFLEKVNETLNSKLHINYKKKIKIFEDRCKQYIKKNFGYVPGTILHYFHGKKQDRKYGDRWKILINHQYDPLRDIFYDAQGLLQLTQNKPEFRDEIRRYFRGRNEDSIDI